MIKKILFNFIIIFFFLLVITLLVLSTKGIETNKFNKLIISKVNQTKNISLELNTINFKLDPKELSLFLETQKPKINYLDVAVPTQRVKVYIDFKSFLKTNLKIKKINLILSELDIIELNKLSKFFKPSNLKNILNNKIQNGKILSEIDIFFNNDGKLENYILKGDVKNFKVDILSDYSLSEAKFSFFADKEDILIKNIFGEIEKIKITDGDIKLNISNGFQLHSNFKTDINLDDKNLIKFSKILRKHNFSHSIKLISGSFRNDVKISLDKTYKLKNYNYDLTGTVKKTKFELANVLNNNFIREEIAKIYIKDTKIDYNLSSKKFKLNAIGEYSFNTSDYQKFHLKNNFFNDLLDLNINFDFKNSLNLDLINYKKNNDTIANFSLNLKKKNNIINIKELSFNEKSNSIKINDLQLRDNIFYSLKKLEVKTSNNNFFVDWGKKILIKGTKFDASNLPKFLKNDDKKNYFTNINNEIEIDFKDMKAPLSERLENFRLIGNIQKGKLVNLSSKGDFGGDKFLDISLKKDKNTDKRFLEIYSDLPRPLLTEYSFFNGLSGGKLLFTSLIDGSKSNSKLKIENFKVVNAPGLIKLLSLADLGGLADLAEGEGLSFDLLEIDMEKDKNILKLNEILALGPSMSVLIEGYQDNTGLTSLKGTLVPAKTLNKMISKIPVIGKIVIPKEVGEGLFGISFKMKGPKDDVKTTINPIRTLTPRFIQKIIDKKKVSK